MLNINTDPCEDDDCFSCSRRQLQRMLPEYSTSNWLQEVNNAMQSTHEGIVGGYVVVAPQALCEYPTYTNARCSTI